MSHSQMLGHEKPPVSWTLFLLSRKREAVQGYRGFPFGSETEGLLHHAHDDVKETNHDDAKNQNQPQAKHAKL